MAKEVKLSEALYRGVTYPFTYQHRNSDGNAPLTGCTVFFTVKVGPFDDNASDTSAIGDPVTIGPSEHTDAENGYTEWDWMVPATGVEPGDYFFDVVVKNSEGKMLPPSAIGSFKIAGKRTNRTS